MHLLLGHPTPQPAPLGVQSWESGGGGGPADPHAVNSGAQWKGRCVCKGFSEPSDPTWFSSLAWGGQAETHWWGTLQGAVADGQNGNHTARGRLTRVKPPRQASRSPCFSHCASCSSLCLDCPSPPPHGEPFLFLPGPILSLCSRTTTTHPILHYSGSPWHPAHGSVTGPGTLNDFSVCPARIRLCLTSVAPAPCPERVTNKSTRNC